MRKLVLFMHMSLDGYVKAPGKDETGRDRTVSSPGEDPGVEDTVVPDLIRDADTLLLGRLVADELLGYWLNAEARDPNLDEGAIAYARWATGAHKAVFSHSEETLPWSDSELLLVENDEDMAQAVTDAQAATRQEHRLPRRRPNGPGAGQTQPDRRVPARRPAGGARRRRAALPQPAGPAEAETRGSAGAEGRRALPPLPPRRR